MLQAAPFTTRGFKESWQPLSPLPRPKGRHPFGSGVGRRLAGLGRSRRGRPAALHVHYTQLRTYERESEGRVGGGKFSLEATLAAERNANGAHYTRATMATTYYMVTQSRSRCQQWPGQCG